MRTVLFLNFTPYKNTPVYAPEDVYIKRVDLIEPISNPGDPREVDELADRLWDLAEPHVSQAAIGGDTVVVALPGTTLMAAALTTRIREVGLAVGVITATRDEEGYVFDLDPSRVLLL